MTIAACENVTKYFSTVKALDGVSIKVNRSECVGLVGESGSGKTTLGKVLLGIIRPSSGDVKISASRLQAVFQDPYSSLDPKMKVLDILSEGLFLRGDRQGIAKKARAALATVRLPESALNKYPHQFSGGEKQRIAMARAVVTEPEFIVCDEPVSSLDVTTQIEILNLIKAVHSRLSCAILFISHDLRVIRYVADRVAVMREGKIVEEGAVARVYSSPSHPYTRLLLSSFCP